MTYLWTRFDIHIEDAVGGPMTVNYEAGDGEWVRAEDAINREAVNAGEIATLKAQLKEANKRGDREYALAEMRGKKLRDVAKIVNGDS